MEYKSCRKQLLLLNLCMTAVIVIYKTDGVFIYDLINRQKFRFIYTNKSYVKKFPLSLNIESTEEMVHNCIETSKVKTSWRTEPLKSTRCIIQL